MSTETQSTPPDWNQGWQDVVIGLSLSFAFIEAITGAILLENRPPVAAPATITVITLIAKILSVVMPPILGYGSYAAMAGWVYRANVRLRATGTDGGLVFGRRIRSPYRLGSVRLFWITIFALVASNAYANPADPHGVAVTAAFLRLGVGVAGACLAVFVRRDIDALFGSENFAEAVDVPVS